MLVIPDFRELGRVGKLFVDTGALSPRDSEFSEGRPWDSASSEYFQLETNRLHDLLFYLNTVDWTVTPKVMKEIGAGNYRLAKTIERERSGERVSKMLGLLKTREILLANLLKTAPKVGAEVRELAGILEGRVEQVLNEHGVATDGRADPELASYLLAASKYQRGVGLFSVDPRLMAAVHFCQEDGFIQNHGPFNHAYVAFETGKKVVVVSPEKFVERYQPTVA